MTLVSTKNGFDEPSILKDRVEVLEFKCKLAVTIKPGHKPTIEDCTFIREDRFAYIDSLPFTCPLEFAIEYHRLKQEQRLQDELQAQLAERAAEEAMDQPEPVEV